MKKVLLYIAIILFIALTIRSASAASCGATWLPDGEETITITYGDEPTFAWYAITAYDNLQTKITVVDVEGNTLATLLDEEATNTYAAGELDVTTNHYSEDGDYTVIVSCTDLFGHAGFDYIEFSVIDTPQYAPEAHFTYEPVTPETNDPIIFTDASTDSDGVIVSYDWDFNDGTTSSLENPTHTYTEPGDYLISLTVTDNDGLQDTATETITVDESYIDVDFTAISVTATPEEGFAPLQVNFTCDAVGGNAPVSYEWTFGDGETAIVSAPDHTYAVAGTYVATCTATDNDGDTISDSVTITVEDAYVDVDFTAISVTATPEEGFAPLQVNFTCDAVGGNAPVSYEWSFGDGETAIVSAPDHTYAVAGTYVAMCTATDNDGDTISDSVTITVEDEPALIIDEFGCNPAVVQGHVQRCSAHVVDANNISLAGATVTIHYTNGDAFGTCITNEKGYCSAEQTITLAPATYVVEATAHKEGYEPQNSLQDSFNVWEERYDITYLELFEDEAFEHVQDTFYRNNPIYAAFAIYDLNTETYVCDSDLVNNVFLKVHNENSVNFTELELTALSMVEPTLLERFLSLFGVNTYSAYAYELPKIPLTDDMLGTGKVFAFTFNFSDDTAGQESKEVTILNNEVLLDLPENFTLVKQSLDDSASITIDFKNYVSDIETAPENMIFEVATTNDFVMTEQATGVFTITANPEVIGDFAMNVTVDDTDGSVAQDTTTLHVVVETITEAPIAIIDVATTKVDTETVVTFDGSASYDPDGGDIVAYEWNFDNGMTATGETVEATFAENGRYFVTLTVTDDDGETATDTVIMTVVETYHYVSDCADGVDNDGDGLVDKDDPGCQMSGGYSEFNYDLSGIEEGIKLTSFNVMNFDGTDEVIPGELLEVQVVVENVINKEIEDLRVSFMIPDLGVKQKGSLFDLRGNKRTTKTVVVNVPFDATPGLYYAELIVANDDLRKVSYQELSVVI